MSEGFLLDAESLGVIQRHIDTSRLGGDNLGQTANGRLAVPINVFVIDEQDPATGGFKQTYNGYQVVFDDAVGGWVYKKGGVIFGNSGDTIDTEVFDGPRLATLTVFVMGTTEVPSLVIETQYAAYPTWTTGEEVDPELIYVIDTAFNIEVIPGCHLTFDPEQPEEKILDVSVLTLLGGIANMPEEPIQSKYLTFSDGDDGLFSCLFIDINCGTLSPALAGWGLQLQDPPIFEQPCKLMIDIDNTSCEALVVDEFGLAFDAEPLAGLGLVNTFDCQLDIEVGDCGSLGFDEEDKLIIIAAGLVAGDGSGGLVGSADPCLLELDIITGCGSAGSGTDALPLRFAAADVVTANLSGLSASGSCLLVVNTQKSIVVDANPAINALEFVNDVFVPGNDFFYGTNNVGTKNWIDFEDIAGSGISFDNNFDLDIMELVTAVPDPADDFFAFGDVLAIDNQKANLNSMMDAVLTTITVITDIELDGSNNLRIKTTEFDVYNPQAESSFATVTGWTTSDCP